MEIQSIDLLGNSSIGIFSFATNSYGLFPYLFDDSLSSEIKDILNVPIIHTTLNNSNLLGLFSAGNTNHLLLPGLISEVELEAVKTHLPDKVSVHILDTVNTALGNVIVATEKHALVSPEFNPKEAKQIADMLDVEVISKHILGTSIVGSMIFLTDNGLLAHPLIDDDELDWLEDYFSLPVDVVTVNRGTPYPKPGIVGNRFGLLVGSDTTGPELMRIFEVLS